MLTKFKFIKMAAQEYKKRLLEALDEVELIDKQGNIMISKDLKVRHKKSGYEYTVDDIITSPDNGELTIALRSPESPRVPNPGTEELLGGPPGQSHFLGEEDIPLGAYDPEVAEEEEVQIFLVNPEDFEKEYEVT